ncbi:right-handed parallel beta-helix repeat-containing protein [Methylobacterium planeticum]|nr:right-handed parallel beta-helix repeat-containing protein [Methylobacterium planeticum]
MTIYYVSTTGTDGASGAINDPFATLQAAHDQAKAGDTIYMRGGTYQLKSGIHLTNDGTADKPITIENYQQEKVVISAASVSGQAVTLDSASYNHIKGLEIADGGTGGILLSGSSNSNVLEDLDVHGSGWASEWEGKGFSVFGSSANNLLLNNDSHDNHDLRGDNADGFQIATTGAGNVLQGNRAWGNSDDGFDLFNVQDGTKAGAVTIDGNLAWHNGYSASGEHTGNGSGFKLGGTRPGAGGDSGGHTVSNNVAWDNAGTGFDENSASQPLKLTSNTAYDNGTNYYFEHGGNVLSDNLSAGSGNVSVTGTEDHNSWNVAQSVGASAFVSVDASAMTGDRGPDGALPASDFLHVISSSPVAGTGANIGSSGAGSSAGADGSGDGPASGTPQPEPAPIPTTPGQPTSGTGAAAGSANGSGNADGSGDPSSVDPVTTPATGTSGSDAPGEAGAGIPAPEGSSPGATGNEATPTTPAVGHHGNGHHWGSHGFSFDPSALAQAGSTAQAALGHLMDVWGRNHQSGEGHGHCGGAAAATETDLTAVQTDAGISSNSHHWHHESGWHLA